MKRIFIFVWTTALLISLMLASCISDSISTSPMHTLAFSRDTVNFDTVFTDLGTPTARLIAFNRADKGVMVSKISLANQQSCFSINVDGQSGRDFHDVEISAKDSIYIFIECFIPETAGNQPYLVEDELVFVTNGVTQRVRLEAYGQNVTRLRGLCIDSDMTLTAERPYVIMDSLVVGRNATLRVNPGVQMLFHDDARLRVAGRLEAIGTPDSIIQMRGDRLDNVLPNVGYDILAGQWQGIYIDADSYENRLEYVDMRSTEFGILAENAQLTADYDLSRTKLTLRNSWLHNSQANVLSARYAKIEAYGVCFSEAAKAVVYLEGGEHLFTQCTFANNYLFSAISEPILTLAHLKDEDLQDNPAPLMKAHINNSIIYGITSGINIGDLTGTQVYLQNVSLKAEGTDDDNFINCLWNTDPLFLTDRSRYYFNYHVQPDSPVIGKGDPALVPPAALYDIDGINRLTDTPAPASAPAFASGSAPVLPTLGAYALPQSPAAL